MRRTISSVLLALAALARGLPAAAQTSSTDEEAETTAAVVLDGYTLFQVRGARSYPAERRAGEIADRIARVAADRSMPVDSLKIRETPVASLVLAEDRLLLGVLDADAELEGVNRQVLAEGFRRRIVEAVRQFRREREPARLCGGRRSAPWSRRSPWCSSCGWGAGPSLDPTHCSSDGIAKGSTTSR